MTDLQNSRRVSYKATYNQISGQSIVQQGSGKQLLPHRAFEKAAFVQSLQIRPGELSAIRAALSRIEAVDVPPEAFDDALLAIESLISDETATSTLNQAARFGTVSAQALAHIAQMLIDRRRQTNVRVGSLLQSIAAAQVEQAWASDPGQDVPVAERSTSPGIIRTTRAGLVVRVEEDSATQERTATKPGLPDIEAVATASTVQLEADSTGDFASGEARAATRLGGTALSGGEALAWAQQNQPKQFAELRALLMPFSGLSHEQLRSERSLGALTNALAACAASNPKVSQGALEGFLSRMAIEPIGNLHLERVEMYPSGVERGELVHSLPLAPGETVNISHKEWSVTQREFEDLVRDYFEGYSEEGVAEKTDIALSSDAQSQHATALNIGASLTASYSSVTLSTNFGYTSSSNDSLSRKDSRNHSIAMTKKASSRAQRDHKVTFKVTSVTGSEDQSVRVLSNPSATDGMRLDYFQLARKWKVDLLRYGLRMTYDIVIPNPGASIATLVQSVQELDALIDTPFAFDLALGDITYNSLATDPHKISTTTSWLLATAPQ
ncbi:MAG: hypothetical protein GX454_01365 [Brooklawnia sp.]|nr:hypothetical protein [Brooklawnia sp.]